MEANKDIEPTKLKREKVYKAVTGIEEFGRYAERLLGNLLVGVDKIECVKFGDEKSIREGDINVIIFSDERLEKESKKAGYGMKYRVIMYLGSERIVDLDRITLLLRRALSKDKLVWVHIAVADISKMPVEYFEIMEPPSSVKEKYEEIADNVLNISYIDFKINNKKEEIDQTLIKGHKKKFVKYVKELTALQREREEMGCINAPKKENIGTDKTSF